MLKNLTLGQYIKGNSFLHKATPKSKLVVTFAYIFILFFFSKISTFVFGFLVVVVLYKVCKIPLKLAFNNFKTIMFIMIFTSIINLFFGRKGEVLFKFLVFEITKESLNLTILVIVRIFLLMSGVAILTYTTLPLDLARCISDFFKPLKKFKFPVEEISTMLSISIRFVPLLVDETQKIIFAQKSRGVNISGKGIKNKIKFIISILVPLLVSSFKRADDLAVAMESRCYKIGAERTRYITFKINGCDYILIFSFFVFFVCLFLVNFFSYF